MQNKTEEDTVERFVTKNMETFGKFQTEASQGEHENLFWSVLLDDGK